MIQEASVDWMCVCLSSSACVRTHNDTVYCTMTAMWYLLFWDSFLLINPLHWHRLTAAMWLVGVQNTMQNCTFSTSPRASISCWHWSPASKVSVWHANHKRTPRLSLFIVMARSCQTLKQTAKRFGIEPLAGSLMLFKKGVLWSFFVVFQSACIPVQRPPWTNSTHSPVSKQNM